MTTSTITEADLLPKRRPGRQSDTAVIEYEEKVAHFCSLILQIKSTMDFAVGSRGWCYLLEHHGLHKGNFDAAEKLISDCGQCRSWVIRDRNRQSMACPLYPR